MLLKGLRLRHVDKARLDTELLEGVLHLREGAAVKLVRADEVVARPHEGQERVLLSTHAACRREGGG